MFSGKKQSTIAISIDFPALDNLVAWLRENEQQQIDALTEQLGGIAPQLKASADALRKAIADEQK